MLNRGADEVGPRKTTGQGGPSAGRGAVAAVKAGWVEGTISTANSKEYSRRCIPRLRERAPPRLQEGRVQTTRRIVVISKLFSSLVRFPTPSFVYL